MAAKKTRKKRVSVAQKDKALRGLLTFVTSGRRYETRNPYSIPEVTSGFLALGLDRYGEKPKDE